MPSLVRPIDVDRLRDLGTRELLGLLRRLRACEESIEVSDATPGEVDPAIIRFKNDPRWLELDRAVRAVLATREHVPGGEERAAARVKRARAQRTNERRAGRPANRVSGGVRPRRRRAADFRRTQTKTTAYRLGELTRLAAELGFECDQHDEVRVVVRLAPDAVLAFCNLESGDTIVCFEGTLWHSHGVVQFMTGIDTYVECDELDIVRGLSSGELVVVAQYLKGQLKDRWLAHKNEPLDLRHLEPGEELRVLRLRVGGML